MAKLVIRDDATTSSVIELNLGVNRVGRSADADFQIVHPTVSAFHCEFVLSDGAVLVRDCGSANGTFVNGEPIQEAALLPGQTVRLGSVELFVESTDVTIAIPAIETERPKPPMVLADGTILCPRHAQARAVWRCTHCREVMCDGCVHRLRRKGGKTLRLCPLCSHKLEPITVTRQKKKSLIDFLRTTVRIPFLHRKETLDGKS